MTSLTVTIITRNRADILSETLKALCVQDAPSGSFEILVVDNASTDGTPAVVSQFASHGVRYAYEPNLGVANARNRALAETTTPLIAFLDDDTIPVKGWVTAHLSVYESVSPTPAAVGGRIYIRWSDKQPVWFHQDMAGVLGFLDYGDTLMPVQQIFGGNMSVQADLMRCYGGFNPRLVKALGEETWFLEELHRDGYVVYYQPQATVWHAIGPSKERPEHVIKRYYLSGITEAIMTVLDHFPGRLRLLREVERHLLAGHRAYGVSAADWYNLLSRRALPTTPDALLRRCKLAKFIGFEHQLLKFLRKGSFYASDDLRLIHFLGG